MILTAHQPVYLPWLGLFHKIALADTFVLYDDVQYLRGDWNNRNKIKTAGGPIWLTIPVVHSDLATTLHEIEIDNRKPWRRKHWRTIRESYAHAPYFAQLAPFLEQTYAREWQLLSQLCEHILLFFIFQLGIDVHYLRASELKLEGRNSDRVLDLCKKLKADVFIFGALGRNYARVDDFEKENIDVVFQDYLHPAYPQQHGPFLSHLSVLDLVANCGPRSLEVLMSGNVGREQLLKSTLTRTTS